ncbi:helix-turn-helix domain-containing protein [Shivajiella indica]|uniref:Helix-turn-helix domain-containing protein n=1 Tax=Shivajiella indica TaxID=872115 RepID=A0ABW5BAA4_9BACT
METQITDRLELAAHFVNSTNSPIFLTGKAGTGKTTFLKNLAELTHKKFVVLAPTGIAALHAKGVTIHSQFLLPLGSFLPTREPEGNYGKNASFYTQYSLGRRHTLNLARKKVLNSLELLIIDEVSMLRADILDAIDYRMRSVKRNFQEPFGGVQVLMIGDLFQLPPIVKDYEWEVLGKFYKSMHFFEAHALKQSGMVYIELDKIFRQKDDNFIKILNNLRENRVTEEDVKFLNRYYKTGDEIKNLEDTIIITTHNYKAEEQNIKELNNLKSPSHYFEAIVEKDFPDNLYPLPKTLELKVGAQIMFIKNDSSGFGEYFNGKMAKVESIEGEKISVLMAGEKIRYTLKRETWENKRYIINEETKELEEDIIGTFEQFPVKLAWAVTVHKSQGLTFDKAIIDVGQAFAPGQVYVALSRLRGLEGLILRTRIQPNVIYSDHEVVNFTTEKLHQDSLEILLGLHQRKYIEKLLQTTFDFEEIIQGISAFSKDFDSSLGFEDIEMQTTIPKLYEGILLERENTLKFRRQLLMLLQEKEEEKLLERLEKGSIYYGQLVENSLERLYIHLAEVERFTKTKKYIEGLSEIDLLLIKKLGEIKKITSLIPCIFHGFDLEKIVSISKDIAKMRIEMIANAKLKAKENPKFATTKTGRKKKADGEPRIKLAKGETYEITYKLSEEGNSIAQIASLRNMAESTIKGHLAKGIQEGKASIFDHFTEDLIEEVKGILKRHDADFGVIRQEYPDKYDYGTLKMVAAHMGLLE